MAHDLEAVPLSEITYHKPVLTFIPFQKCFHEHVNHPGQICTSFGWRKLPELEEEDAGLSAVHRPLVGHQ